ncbi:MAG: sensor histidine kinase [Bacillota bacterium]
MTNFNSGDYMKDKYVFYTKLLILTISLLHIVMGIGERNMASALFILLLLVLNMQIRSIYFKGKAFILSLLGDMAMICFLYQSYGGYIFFPLLATAVDGIVYGNKFNYAAFILTSLVYVWFILPLTIEAKMLCMFIYLILSASSFMYVFLNNKLKEVEYLYDDVRKYSQELESAKKQIELYSHQVENLASVKERQRISEEIHDTIGHRLTALLMQMEAGVRLLDSGNQSGRELLDMSVENLRESIDVLRQTVRSMRPKQYRNLIFSIEEMLKKFKRETGINTSFDVKGAAVRLLPGVEMVLYKNVQEAVTNAVRHGKARNILIQLIYEEAIILLRIKDDGAGCTDIKKGIGLSAMEDRLKFVGGSLNIDGSSGFIIENRIPISNFSETE